MTLYVAGVDERGASAILETIETGIRPEQEPVEQYVRRAHPRSSQLSSIGAAAPLESGVAPGEMLWRVTTLPVGWEYAPMHRIQTIDIHTVIHGELEVRLDDGAHILTSGDVLFLPGLDHAWRVVGDQDVLLSTVQLDTSGS
jgi:uncharacterized cupin superfamily protein